MGCLNASQWQPRLLGFCFPLQPRQLEEEAERKRKAAEEERKRKEAEELEKRPGAQPRIDEFTG